MAFPQLDPTALARSSHKPGSPIGRVVFIVACLVAAAIAGYLTSMKWTGQITELAGCGGDDGCSQVLRGRWANWMLVPISAWAFVTYVVLLIIALIGFGTPARRRWAFAGASILAAAAVWFLGIQLLVAQQLCRYCMTMHVCGLIALAAAATQIVSSVDELQRGLRTAVISVVIAMTALIAGQLWGPVPASHTITDESLEVESPLSGDSITGSSKSDNDVSADADPAPVVTTSATEKTAPANQPLAATTDSRTTPDTAPAADAPSTPVQAAVTRADQQPPSAPAGRVISYFGGKLRYPIERLPHVGDPNAPHVLVKFFDYTCPACRKMHVEMEKLRHQFEDQIAIILIPCPLHRKCNPHVDASVRAEDPHEFACELAELAIAVWYVAPDKFFEFHNLLFDRQGRLNPTSARLVAEVELDLPAGRLEQALQDPRVGKLLGHSIKVYGQLRPKNPSMPKVLLGGSQILHGGVRETERFQAAMIKTLKLEK